ncbi:MAG TPA: hypothetical protein DHW64_04030, partial [Chitinophagaceae bacterium]|nr:hypothetical protein [Chitinophagaceae bacterium]
MKAARQLTIAMLTLAVIAALYSGYSLISDPTGSSLGIPFYWLNGTMFKDFTTPGWIILLAIGVLGLITIATVIKRIRHFHLLVIVQGAIICILVIAQMIIIGEENMLQYLFLMMGMAIAIVGGLLSHAD